MDGQADNGQRTPEQDDAYVADLTARHMLRARLESVEKELERCYFARECERKEDTAAALAWTKEREKLLNEALEADRRVELVEARLDDARVRHTLVRRELSRVLSMITHGETRKVHDVLRQVVTRLDEATPPEPLAELRDSIIPVKGRGLDGASVGFSFLGSALVIRVDHPQQPEFWMTIEISETRLLRLLASLHRQCHGDSRPTSG